MLQRYRRRSSPTRQEAAEGLSWRAHPHRFAICALTGSVAGTCGTASLRWLDRESLRQAEGFSGANSEPRIAVELCRRKAAKSRISAVSTLFS